MLYIFTFIIISGLILTNAVTDAPNSIATLVGTNVMNFKKAARMSAIFNFLGIIIMSFINISVANCISLMVTIDTGETGIVGLMCAMIAVIVFSLISLYFGIPTSETHGLIAGLTGSSIALYGLKNAINWSEWKNVIIGLVWSVFGTYIISKFIVKILKNIIDRISMNTTKRGQIIGSIGMSFMHGAQDGQKFIGVIIIFLAIYNKVNVEEILNMDSYIWTIVFTAILMLFGVSIGGKRIVQKVGTEMATLSNKEALLSDVVTTLTLLIASLTGLPVSTTHVKTISIVTLATSTFGKNKVNRSIIINIIKAWIYTFPICGAISYILAYIYRIILYLPIIS